MQIISFSSTHRNGITLVIICKQYCESVTCLRGGDLSYLFKDLLLLLPRILYDWLVVCAQTSARMFENRIPSQFANIIFKSSTHQSQTISIESHNGLVQQRESELISKHSVHQRPSVFNPVSIG